MIHLPWNQIKLIVENVECLCQPNWCLGIRKGAFVEIFWKWKNGIHEKRNCIAVFVILNSKPRCSSNLILLISIKVQRNKDNFIVAFVNSMIKSKKSPFMEGAQYHHKCSATKKCIHVHILWLCLICEKGLWTSSKE